MVEHNLAKVGVASSSLVFRSKWKRQLQAVFFRFALSETMARTERPHSPLPGVGGVNIIREKSLARSDPKSPLSGVGCVNIVRDYPKTYTALSLYLSRVKCRVLRVLVLSN